MDRRFFLKSVLAGAATLVAQPLLRSFAAVSPPSEKLSSVSQPILHRAISKSGEKIPVIGLGTSGTFNAGASASERAPLKEVLRLFYESGGRVIDTSPMYKRAEIVIGDLAAELGLNENFFMATKVWTKGKGAGIRQMNESFDKLRVRTMELMQVHNLVDLQTQLKTLRQWKEEGRIRYIGITHSHASAFNDLEKVMRAEDLDFVQLNYSIAEPEAAERLLPLAQDRGIAILANRPFARGSLFKKVRGKNLPEWAKEFDCESWAQFFLKFVISHPAVTCAIPATSKPHHLVDNMKGGTGRLPDEFLRRRMFDSI